MLYSTKKTYRNKNGVGAFPTGVGVGIGDDGAVIESLAGEETVLATDTLVEG